MTVIVQSALPGLPLALGPCLAESNHARMNNSVNWVILFAHSVICCLLPSFE